MSVCPRPDKRAHATEQAAGDALRARRAAAGRSGRQVSRWLSVYRCTCGWWHIGDQRPTLQRKIREANLPPSSRGPRP